MTSEPRPRYGRIAAFSLAVLVTGTTLLAGLGALPQSIEPAYAGGQRGKLEAPILTGIWLWAASTGSQAAEALERKTAATEALALPPDSGEGRRVVFDMGDQRVWLVKDDGSVLRTYLVSGSRYDNVDPGTYEVYSRSKHAYGIDDSGTMRYMVRFARGANAAIGFHDIPVLDGKRVQSRDELGTPLSHGCVRQWRPDAKALWRFAPVGTTVVVTE